jgi:hypothetical protein
MMNGVRTMKTRSSEAARMEADYLARVRQALGARRDAQEIVQSVVEHVEDAVGEFKDLEVSLVQMAQVIQRLGPPEAFAEGQAAPTPSAPGGGMSPESRRGYAQLLDRAWVASLIKTVGLFVPFIDFYFCSLIGHGMLASALRPRDGFPEEFRTLGRLCKTVAIITVVHAIVAGLALAEPLVGIAALPTGAALVALPLVVYWKLLGGISSVLRQAGAHEVAQSTLDARRVYITIQIVFIVIAIVIGAAIGAAYVGQHGGRARMERELVMLAVGFGMLPIGWIISYFLLLRPISRARTALAKSD